MLKDICDENCSVLFFTRFFSWFLQKVILRNGSEMFEYWTKPPLDPIIRAYVFNYTNIFKVLDGVDTIIELEEVGPYVYREQTLKTDVKIEGDLISFRVNFVLYLM